MVELKRPPITKYAPGQGNYVRLRLSPEVVIALGARVKTPGEAMISEPTELSVVHYRSDDEMGAYERLLSDAMAGDPTLFAREDAVEAAWRIVEPRLSRAARRAGTRGDASTVGAARAGSCRIAARPLAPVGRRQPGRQDRHCDRKCEKRLLPQRPGRTIGWPCGVARAASSQASRRARNSSARTIRLSATSFSSVASQ
jgi:Glucose-6-phosphate dehydrogenase, C-terminal domain